MQCSIDTALTCGCIAALMIQYLDPHATLPQTINVTATNQPTNQPPPNPAAIRKPEEFNGVAVVARCACLGSGPSEECAKDGDGDDI
jgi:hypothetical protein